MQGIVCPRWVGPFGLQPLITDPETQRIYIPTDESEVSSVSQCLRLCEKKKDCNVFSYFQDGVQNCSLFKFKDLPIIENNINAKTYVSEKLIKKQA